MKKERYWQIGLVLLGALPAAAVTWWVSNQPDAIHSLQYLEIRDAGLHKALGTNNPELQIIYGDREIDALSRVNFQIANLSSQNLGQFKLYFEIEGDVQPLFHSYQSNTDFPIQEITQLDPLTYEFSYLNRSESIVDGISYTFQFAQEVPPLISAKVGTQGISISKYVEKDFYGISSNNFVITIISVLFGLLGFGILNMLSRLPGNLSRVFSTYTQDIFKDLAEAKARTISEDEDFIKKAVEEAVGSGGIMEKYMVTKSGQRSRAPRDRDR